MEQQNWGSSENGAQIAEVSEEASLASSSASNLLNPHEDQLWITGSAPQYVILKLSPVHPPLKYVGWHVWHSYPTNPGKVEIASGASINMLKTLLICQALPGAGTQMWLLPTAIPTQHLYVRLKIIETFSPGPTYMSSVVLLAEDPGPGYGGGLVPPAFSEPPLNARAAVNSHASSVSPAVLIGHGEDEQLPPQAPALNVTSMERSHSLLNTSNATNAEPRNIATQSISVPTREKSCGSRIGKLLRDLEEDIRTLHPIKGVRVPPNLIFAAPRDASMLLQSPTETSNSPSTEEASNRLETSHTHEASRRGHGLRKHSHQQQCGCPPQCRCTSVVDWKGHEGALDCLPSPLSMPVDKLHDRIAMLERTVASLVQTVQHQREDLTMIKRLLLEQAMERRKASERRHNTYPQEKQPHDGVLLASNSSDHRLIHHQTDVALPQEALQGYVESIIEKSLRKKGKKIESRMLKQLDMQLKDVVRPIYESVFHHLEHTLQPQEHRSGESLYYPANHSEATVSNGTTRARFSKNKDATSNRDGNSSEGAS